MKHLHKTDTAVFISLSGTSLATSVLEAEVTVGAAASANTEVI